MPQYSCQLKITIQIITNLDMGACMTGQQPRNGPHQKSNSYQYSREVNIAVSGSRPSTQTNIHTNLHQQKQSQSRPPVPQNTSNESIQKRGTMKLRVTESIYVSAEKQKGLFNKNNVDLNEKNDDLNYFEDALESYNSKNHRNNIVQIDKPTTDEENSQHQKLSQRKEPPNSSNQRGILQSEFPENLPSTSLARKNTVKQSQKRLLLESQISDLSVNGLLERSNIPRPQNEPIPQLLQSQVVSLTKISKHESPGQQNPSKDNRQERTQQKKESPKQNAKESNERKDDKSRTTQVKWKSVI